MLMIDKKIDGDARIVCYLTGFIAHPGEFSQIDIGQSIYVQ